MVLDASESFGKTKHGLPRKN